MPRRTAVVAASDLAELDRRVVAAADALWRREASLRRDVTLDRDDVRQIGRETALVKVSEKPDATVSYVVSAVHWRILDAFRRDRREAARRSGFPDVFDDDERVVFRPGEDPAEETLERLAGSSEYVAAVWLAVWMLPDAQRDVLLLKAEGFTPGEIAERLGVSTAAVKSRTNRARTALFTLKQEALTR